MHIMLFYFYWMLIAHYLFEIKAVSKHISIILILWYTYYTWNEFNAGSVRFSCIKLVAIEVILLVAKKNNSYHYLRRGIGSLNKDMSLKHETFYLLISFLLKTKDLPYFYKYFNITNMHCV